MRMPCGSDISDYAEKVILRLGIGSKRAGSAPPDILFKTDYARELIRQEVRLKVREARIVLGKRIEEVLNLDGRPILVGKEDSSDTMHLDFDSVFSGLDLNGNVFVSTSDTNIPEDTTLFFMSNKEGGWNVEAIPHPNLNTAYFRVIAREEERLSEEEREASETGRKQ
jgi:hypothetical protein